jgi:hypothetical protein
MRKLVSPVSFTRTRRSIMADDRLDVLVVDGDALEAVDLLDLVDEPGGEGLLALHFRMSCGLGGPSMSGSPARTRSPGCTWMCLPFGIRYSRACSELAARNGVTRTLRLPFVSLPKETSPSISADDGVILRLAGLEELGDAGQTARDVLRLRGLARDLRDDLAGLDDVAVVHLDVGADREVVAREVVAVRELERLARRRP